MKPLNIYKHKISSISMMNKLLIMITHWSTQINPTIQVITSTSVSNIPSSDTSSSTTPTDSIMEIINLKHVENILSQKRWNLSSDIMLSSSSSSSSEKFQINNNNNRESKNHDRKQHHHNKRPWLNDYNKTLLSQSIPIDLQHHQFHHQSPNNLLKSSRNALYITRKEYLKKDWCKTEPLIQQIRETGCITRNIINRFCYGQCNSFYIPKGPSSSSRRRSDNIQRRQQQQQQHNNKKSAGNNNPVIIDGGGGGGGGGDNGDLGVDIDGGGNEFAPEDLTQPVFRSCAFCKPKSFVWISVTLKCPRLSPPIQRKKIQRIKHCKCIAQSLGD